MMNNLFARKKRGYRGETLVTVLVAMAVGSLVLGGFMMFWLSSNSFQKATTDHTRQQSSGLAAVNRISSDVTKSSSVLLAESSQMVLLQYEADGSRTWVRYVVHTDGKLYKQMRTNAPVTFDPLATSNFPTPTSGAIVDRVRTSSTDNAELFRYVQSDGTRLTAADLPRSNGSATEINLVEIAFAADSTRTTGKDSQNIELRTSAALNTAPVVEDDPVRPTCPTPRWLQGDPYPRLGWNMTGQTTGFQIIRQGDGGLGLVDRTFTVTDTVTTDTLEYEWSDPDFAGRRGTSRINYTVIATGPGGTSTNCSVIPWFPRLANPNVTITMTPATPEFSSWPASGGSVATLTWPRVTGANYYEVYRRTLTPLDVEAGEYVPSNTSTWSLIVPGGTIQQTSAASYTVTQNLGWDEAYQYRVVAWGPMPESSPLETHGTVLTHTQSPGATFVDLNGRGSNQVRWDNSQYGPTATEASLWRRDLSGCFGARSSWTKIGEFDLEASTYTDNDAIAGTRYEYAVAAYNFGPRGTVSGGSALRYSSRVGTSDNQLQYPANPITTATGSSGGPAPTSTPSSAGTNVASITSGCTSTTDSYSMTIWANRSQTPVAVLNPAPMVYNHTGRPRATRYYYKAVAYNAIGDSANAATGSTGAAQATQYPTPVPTPSLNTYSPYNSPITKTTTPAGQGNPAVSSESCSYAGQQMTPRYGYVTRTGTRFKEWKDTDGDGDLDAVYEDYEYQSYEITHYDHTGDYWSCDRWYQTTSMSWATADADDGDANKDGSAPDERFCADGSCSYQVTYSYTYYNAYSGSTSTTRGALCTVTTSAGNPAPTSCEGPGYGGSLVRHQYSLFSDSTTPARLLVRNPGGSAISGYTDNPGPVTPDPVTTPSSPPFIVIGSEEGSDNRNVIYYQGVPQATSYRIVAYNAADSPIRTINIASPSAAAGSRGTFNFSYIDYPGSTGIPAGSEIFYRVFATNSAGTSATGVRKAAYQRPQVVNLRETAYNATNNTVSLAWDDAIDAGGTVRFCDAGRGDCKVFVRQVDPATGDIIAEEQEDQTVLSGTYTIAPGSDGFFEVALCNKGGCAEDTEQCGNGTTVLCEGGRLEDAQLIRAYAKKESRGVKWQENLVWHDHTDGSANPAASDIFAPGDAQRHNGKAATLNPLWKKVDGATAYRLGRTSLRQDPFASSRAFPTGYTAAPATGFIGNINTNPAASTRWNSARPSGSTAGLPNRQLPDADAQVSTPGAVYQYDLYAKAQGGDVYVTSWKIMAAPAKNAFSQATIFCKNTLPSSKWNVWKLGYQYIPNATSWNGSTSADTMVTKTKTLIWAGGLTPSEWGSSDNITKAAFNRARTYAGIKPVADSGDDTSGTEGDDDSSTGVRYLDGTFPEESPSAPNDGGSDWEPERWDEASPPNRSTGTGSGWWYSNLPGTGGRDASSSIISEVWGGNDDKLALGTGPRTAAAISFYTWINPNAPGYTDLDSVYLAQSGAVHGIRHDDQPNISAPANCDNSSWGPIPARHSKYVQRWASQYSGFLNAGRLGSKPTGGSLWNVSR